MKENKLGTYVPQKQHVSASTTQLSSLVENIFI